MTDTERNALIEEGLAALKRGQMKYREALGLEDCPGPTREDLEPEYNPEVEWERDLERNI